MLGAPSPVRAALAVEGRLFDALAVLRLIVLLNAVGLNLYRGVGGFERPGLGYAALVTMVLWSAVATWAYRDAARRGAVLLVADLGVAIVLLALSPVVKGASFDASLPGFWVMAALLAWSIRFRLVGGIVAGVVLAGVDLSVRDQLTQNDYGNLFLVLIGGPIVGYMCGSLQQMAAERDVAERARAAADERARLARVVHDGVLQVLALVQRRGGELGRDGAELGRLAGEQESALRTLIRAQDAVVPATGGLLASGAARQGDAPATAQDGGDDRAGETVDLAAQLGRLGLRPGVDVVVPGGVVVLPAPVVAELVAVVAACLDNVARHVGEDAPAWVLLEDFPDRVEVAVRDEGPGIAEGRLEQAQAQGRLGVSESIRGRIRDLGGTATLSSGSYGTEWELTVPRTAPTTRRGR